MTKPFLGAKTRRTAKSALAPRKKPRALRRLCADYLPAKRLTAFELRLIITRPRTGRWRGARSCAARKSYLHARNSHIAAAVVGPRTMRADRPLPPGGITRAIRVI